MTGVVVIYQAGAGKAQQQRGHESIELAHSYHQYICSKGPAGSCSKCDAARHELVCRAQPLLAGTTSAWALTGSRSECCRESICCVELRK